MTDQNLAVVKQFITYFSFMLLGSVVAILVTGASKPQIYALIVVVMVLAFVASLAAKILLNVDVGYIVWSIQGGVIFPYFGNVSLSDIRDLLKK